MTDGLTPDERLLRVLDSLPRVYEDDPFYYPTDPHFYPYSIQLKRRFVRHWQIEWEGCQHAARGWTRKGCWRRGGRWRRWSDLGRPFGLTWFEWHAERTVWRLRRLVDNASSEVE